MYRRKAVIDAGSYRPFFEGSEDYDLWFRLSKIGQLNNLNSPLTRYRTNPGQYSSKFSSYRIELDSLVRLLNSVDSQKLPSLNYYETLSGEKIKEYYYDSLKQVEVDNHNLYNDLKNSQQFSNLLHNKKKVNKKFLDYLSFILISFKLVLRSPRFFIKILIGRII
jgi:hypothetical protein